jgi:hypothetical protein
LRIRLQAEALAKALREPQEKARLVLVGDDAFDALRQQLLHVAERGVEFRLCHGISVNRGS